MLVFIVYFYYLACPKSNKDYMYDVYLYICIMLYRMYICRCWDSYGFSLQTKLIQINRVGVPTFCSVRNRN